MTQNNEKEKIRKVTIIKKVPELNLGLRLILASYMKKDLRSIYDLNPRYCKVCGKRLHAKQDILCSRKCLGTWNKK